MFGSNETPSTEFRTIESSERKSFLKRGIAILCAVLVTAAVLIGYTYLRWRHAERLRAETEAQEQAPKPNPSPQLHVFVDDAMIKGPQVLVGGTLLNVSPDTLTGITVEIELKRRKDNKPEIRVIAVEPPDLATNQQGRYSLSVSSHEYRETRVLRIRSTRASGDVAFKRLPGAERPNERLTSRETIVVTPTPKLGKGEEFINTPDNPVKIP